MSKGTKNKVILIGNVGYDPTIHELANAKVMTHFSMATVDSYKDHEGKNVDTTEWHKIVLYGKLAEIACQYVKKGCKVCVEGSIHSKKWTDKEGVEKVTVEIKCADLQLLTHSKGNSAETPVEKPVARDAVKPVKPVAPVLPFLDEEIPF